MYFDKENKKRYNTWNNYLRKNFNGKIFKVPLNLGFSCPNKDGKAGYGGCTYCSPSGSGDFAGNPRDEIISQFDNRKAMMLKKWPNAKYIAYFQANTNTYGPLDTLKESIDSLLTYDKDIIGVSISTRPDCLPDDVVDYLTDLNKRTNLWVELGLQTIHDETGILINRGHDYKTFLTGLNKLRQNKIDVIVHIINGLPKESKEMMIETVKVISQLDIQGIKFHLLHVVKNTKLAIQYQNNEFTLLSMEDYIDIVIKQLELLPPNILIHRLTGDGVREDLIGPLWSLKKWEVLNEIDRQLEIRNSFQGKHFKKEV